MRRGGKDKLGASRFLDPHIQERLLPEFGEVVQEEVRRHWITRVFPFLRILLGMLLFISMPLLGHSWWVALVAGLALGVEGFWRMHLEFMDRFLITNKRVFRVHGVIDQQMAIVPIARVLDISMQRPFWGQIFGYAHFIFESAAQEQGLREIKFVGRPDHVNRQIQRVIMLSGVGGSFEMEEELAGGT
ncbi:MAG: PH domain-containing protein [Micropruina sp.]|nr:PH domain-containing protein [Micropruina sp.]